MSSLVCPGDIIESFIEGGIVIGQGVYLHVDGKQQHVVASVVGLVHCTVMADMKKCMSVIAPCEADESVLKVGDKIMCRATKLSANQTNVDILVVGDKELKQGAKGTIRKEDIQLNEVDTLIMSNCFRPGDLIRAKIISMGDSRSFFCSTAESDCGVKFARSLSGNLMKAINWREMQDIVTGSVELRKVAKPC